MQSSTIDQAHTLNTIEPIRERKYKFQTDYLYFIEGRECHNFNSSSRQYQNTLIEIRVCET